MDLIIDWESSRAPFEQIRIQIADQIADGTLPPGTRLPTVRRLATDLKLAANTVARSYRELEQSGLIETRGRQGSYVPATTSSIELAATDATARYLEDMKALGMTPSDAIRIIEAAIARRS